MTLPREEKIKQLDKKMAQIKAQKQALLRRQNEIERKQRAKRLIPKGALAEKYFDCEKLTEQQVSEMFKKIVDIPAVREIIVNAQLEQDSEVQPPLEWSISEERTWKI